MLLLLLLLGGRASSHSAHITEERVYADPSGADYSVKGWGARFVTLQHEKYDL
jgi:hypothetical protein